MRSVVRIYGKPLSYFTDIAFVSSLLQDIQGNFYYDVMALSILIFLFSPLISSSCLVRNVFKQSAGESSTSPTADNLYNHILHPLKTSPNLFSFEDQCIILIFSCLQLVHFLSNAPAHALHSGQEQPGSVLVLGFAVIRLCWREVVTIWATDVT